MLAYAGDASGTSCKSQGTPASCGCTRPLLAAQVPCPPNAKRGTSEHVCGQKGGCESLHRRHAGPDRPRETAPQDRDSIDEISMPPVQQRVRLLQEARVSAGAGGGASRVGGGVNEVCPPNLGPKSALGSMLSVSLVVPRLYFDRRRIAPELRSFAREH